jgi:hypothetical protein
MEAVCSSETLVLTSITSQWQAYNGSYKLQNKLWFIAFVVTKFSEVFMGNQPNQVAVKS